VHGQEQTDGGTLQAPSDARLHRLLLPPVCYYHGANPKNHGGCPPEKAKGNLNAMTHGAYVKRVLTEEEQRIHDGFIARIHADFTLNDSSDEIAVEMAAISYIQFLRAQKAGKEDAANVQARIVRESLKDLKATKITREGDGKELTTTPAQWAAELLKEVRAASAAAGKGQKDATDEPGEDGDADRTPK